MHSYCEDRVLEFTVFLELHMIFKKLHESLFVVQGLNTKASGYNPGVELLLLSQIKTTYPNKSQISDGI